MARMPVDDLKVAKAAARNQFGQVEGVQGFGLGDGTIRVYVLNAAVANRLPREFQGVPVEVVVTGDITAQ